MPLKAGPIATVFLDSAHAWMAEAATQSQDAIIRTSNGGTTWHRTLLNVTLFRNYVPYFAALTFLNRQAGWLDTIDVHERIARLYRTGDGGAHWTPIAANLPISEILGFQTPALGYGADIEGGGGPGIVYRSKDGGRHWQPFHLSLPPIYRHVRISVMFDSVQTRRQGVILPAIIEPLDLGSHVSLAVYRSNDEGLHWIRGAALDLQSDTNDEITAFANLKDGWAITNRGFCRTVDAGATWRKINTNIILRTGDVIDFLNARLGFVLTTMDTHERLLRTKDAGRTWQVVARLSV